MTFNEFKSDWENKILPVKEDFTRKGQSLMIFLWSVWPEEYKRISYGIGPLLTQTSNNIDCFYVDKLIPNTLEHLEKVWENFPH